MSDKLCKLPYEPGQQQLRLPFATFRFRPLNRKSLCCTKLRLVMNEGVNRYRYPVGREAQSVVNRSLLCAFHTTAYHIIPPARVTVRAVLMFASLPSPLPGTPRPLKDSVGQGEQARQGRFRYPGSGLTSCLAFCFLLELTPKEKPGMSHKIHDTKMEAGAPLRPYDTSPSRTQASVAQDCSAISHVECGLTAS